MKKLISFALVLLMLFSACIMPVAADGENEKREISIYGSQVPIVSIYGDGEPLYDTEGNKVFHFSEMLSMLGGSEDDALLEAVINVLMPFLLEGVVYDKWDNYYAALEKEIGELFAACRLDKNGENHNGVDISQARKDQMTNLLSVDAKEDKGFYAFEDYIFYYDWRLDPLETADRFHEHIQKVKTITGSDKVAVIIRCLGSSVVMAYISKYGLDDIHGISIDASVANGAEIISEPISGKFTVDANAINRMIKDLDALGMFSVDSFVTSSIDLLSKSGAIDSIVGVVKDELYGKIVKGVTSALALSTFFTWPNYWSCVTKEDYEDALLYVFGPEGSEKRAEYKGLIDKFDEYDREVRTKTTELMSSIKEKGCNLCIISKYGLQIAPVVKSRNEIGDQFVSAKRSSYGATTGNVYNTLTDDYINQRIADNKGKYISPDKQIDASTCLYPDYTWFIKGSSHSAWNDFENSLLYTVATAEKQLTIDDFDFSQFIVYDNETGITSEMTTENCNVENWKADEKLENPSDKDEKLVSFLQSLLVWVTALLNFIVTLINK
jgi:hypothetical protein